MSRELKFKAWDIIKGIMFRSEAVAYQFYYLNNNPNVIMLQYTGVCDRKGIEIYEDDVVRITTVGAFARVVWDKERCSFILEPLDKKWLKYSSCYLLGKHHNVCEVLGNLNENPELLKLEEDTYEGWDSADSNDSK